MADLFADRGRHPSSIIQSLSHPAFFTEREMAVGPGARVCARLFGAQPVWSSGEWIRQRAFEHVRLHEFVQSVAVILKFRPRVLLVSSTT